MKTVISTKHDIILQAAEHIKSVIKDKPDAVLAFSTGRSQTELFSVLSDMCRKGDVSFRDTRLFSVTEFVDYNGYNNSRRILEEQLIKNCDFSEDNCRFISADNYEHYDELIADAGGLDLVVLGIGTNAHIGFNEPATMFDSLSHVQKLTDSTKRQYADIFGGEENVPEKGLTMGIKTLVSSRDTILLAFGKEKAEAVHKMVYGKTITYIPASFLQIPMEVTGYFDTEAAEQL